MLVDRTSTTRSVWLGHDFTHRYEFAPVEPLRLAESNGQVKHLAGLACQASHMVADRPTRHAPGATCPLELPNESMHPDAPGGNSTASCAADADMLTSCSPALTHSVFIRRCLGIARRILNRHRVRFDCQRSTNSECSAGTQLLEEVASQIKTALGGLRWAQLGIYGWGIHAKRQPIRPRLCWENERVNIRPTRLPP